MTPAKRTGALLIAWFVLSVVFLLVLEALTLADAFPHNHITAVMRMAWAKEPWVILWLVGSLCYLAGHFFASGRKT